MTVLIFLPPKLARIKHLCSDSHSDEVCLRLLGRIFPLYLEETFLRGSGFVRPSYFFIVTYKLPPFVWLEANNFESSLRNCSLFSINMVVQDDTWNTDWFGENFFFRQQRSLSATDCCNVGARWLRGYPMQPQCSFTPSDTPVRWLFSQVAFDIFRISRTVFLLHQLLQPLKLVILSVLKLSSLIGDVWM